MSHPVIVIGAGGHARVLIDALLLNAVAVIGIVDIDCDKAGTELLGVKVIGDEREISRHAPGEIRLVNGLGSVGDVAKRREIYTRYKRSGYAFASVMHPASVIARDVRAGEGTCIMAGAIIQSGTVIGDNCIVNTGATIDHDCVLGHHVHIAPGVTLSGGVHVGEGTHIGTGASVIQGIRIGSNTVVGAAALVHRNVGDGRKVVGVPAREARA